MSSLIAKISKRAKQIRAKKPGMKWQAAIKQASKELKGKAPKKKAAKKRTPSNRQTGTSKTVIDRRLKAKSPGKRISSKGRVYYERRKNRSDKPGSLSGAGISQDHAIQRVIMKRRLRLKGVSLDSNIADIELQKAYTKLTGRKVPSITKIRAKLKKEVAVSQIIASL